MCIRSENTIRTLKEQTNEISTEIELLSNVKNAEVVENAGRLNDEHDVNVITKVKELQEDEQEDIRDSGESMEGKSDDNDFLKQEYKVESSSSSRSHLKNYYECSSCLEKFESFRDLKQHEFDNHMPGKMCTICNKTFTSVDEVMVSTFIK